MLMIVNEYILYIVYLICLGFNWDAKIKMFKRMEMKTYQGAYILGFTENLFTKFSKSMGFIV